MAFNKNCLKIESLTSLLRNKYCIFNQYHFDSCWRFLTPSDLTGEAGAPLTLWSGVSISTSCVGLKWLEFIDGL